MTNLLLLGAGASVEAGISTAYEMTEKVINSAALTGTDIDYNHNLARDVFHFVLGALRMQRGVRGLNPDAEKIDIEELAGAITFLVSKETSDFVPFISSWHPQLCELEKRSSIEIDILLKALMLADIEPQDRGEPGEDFAFDFVSRLIDSYRSQREKSFTEGVRKRRQGEVFEMTRDVLLTELSKQLWINEPEKTNYLQSLLRAVMNGGALTVATLNYDNTIETCAEQMGITISTGVQDWSKNKTMPVPGIGLFLLKLHGSINWYFKRENQRFVRERVEVTEKPYHVFAPEIAGDMDTKYSLESGIIFGSGNKLTAEGPFLDLLFTLKNELNKARNLYVVGYSFRDKHINSIIDHWFRANSDRKLIVASPSIVANIPPPLILLQDLRAPDVRLIPAKASEVARAL